jgi:hypothetical protein
MGYRGTFTLVFFSLFCCQSPNCENVPAGTPPLSGVFCPLEAQKSMSSGSPILSDSGDTILPPATPVPFQLDLEGAESLLLGISNDGGNPITAATWADGTVNEAVYANAIQNSTFSANLPIPGGGTYQVQLPRTQFCSRFVVITLTSTLGTTVRVTGYSLVS